MEITPAFRDILSGKATGVCVVVLRIFLRVASLPYWLGASVLALLYDKGIIPARKVDVPVISVGNITAGGTGKTPAVEFVAKWFIERGAKPAVLSRGYNSREGEHNDENLLLRKRLPEVPLRQNPSRYTAALEAIKEDGANVLILDDGFQHRKLARFGDIVLVDATCPFGYGSVLPRGLLREPLKGLKRADVIVVTRADQVDESTLERLLSELDRIAPKVEKAVSRHEPTAVYEFPNGKLEPTSALENKRLALFSSIGNPNAFRLSVESVKGNVEQTIAFPDHHWYEPEDIEQILSDASVDAFVTTEKDAVKLKGLWQSQTPLYVMCIEMKIGDGSGSLTKLFEEALEATQHVEEKV